MGPGMMMPPGLGRMGRFGPLPAMVALGVGAVVLGILPEVFRPLTDYRMFLYAALLLLMIRFQPGGLLGENSFVRSRLLGARGGKNR